ncbi:MAG: hypothetical protein GEV12_19120 [Micromonosporaceae bacterium]|nr:hypothetical protein [Micromonosporaceae bacterium]
MSGEPRDVPPGVDRAAFRIVQEALTNVARHATITRPHSMTGEHGNHVDVTRPEPPITATRSGSPVAVSAAAISPGRS